LTPAQVSTQLPPQSHYQNIFSPRTGLRHARVFSLIPRMKAFWCG
jgi:hypothetical protein